MWSTFVPYIPNSILPGAISFVLAMVAAIMVSLISYPISDTKYEINVRKQRH